MSREHPFPRRTFLKSLGVALPVAGFTEHTDVAVNYFGTLPIQPAADLERLQALLKNKEPNVWLFTGDSITHGAKHTMGYRSYPEIFEERMRWELARTRDWVINTGISSQTIKLILADFEWRVAKFAPSVVSIMIGTNDCSKSDIPTDVFETELTRFVAKVRELKAIPILHTPNPVILEVAGERKTLPVYVDSIRKVAEKEQTILVDNYLYWTERHKRYMNNVYKQWLNDFLHPNHIGHQQIARLMFRTLDIFDSEQPTCGAEYYESEH
jgi:acyl-CoA thioesterase-1